MACFVNNSSLGLSDKVELEGNHLRLGPRKLVTGGRMRKCRGVCVSVAIHSTVFDLKLGHHTQ